MEWFRGEEIGHGSFGTINKAKPKKPSSQLPSIMAVKSSETPSSSSLQNEKSVLEKIGPNPNIIRCFGAEESFESNQSLYNLFLEYASGGSLAARVRRRSNGGGLPEPEIRRHARSLLRGLRWVHSRGFVHCDVKLENVLLFGAEAKLADFGLAKPASEPASRAELRGTPMYMAPESVEANEYGPPCDVWALGCAVAEMASGGRPVWAHQPGVSIWALLMKIVGSDGPEIPPEVSEEGRDFLTKCFVKDPAKRWTAEMLLNHPFVCGDDDDDHDHLLDGLDDEVFSVVSETSPRCQFDFPEWVSGSDSGLELSSAVERVRRLVTVGDVTREWTVTNSWVTVRE